MQIKGMPHHENEFISFHDAQKLIGEFRKNRIQQFKLMYPLLVLKHANVSSHRTSAPRSEDHPHHYKKAFLTRVGDSVAPPSMFKRGQGLSNSDLIEQVR